MAVGGCAGVVDGASVALAASFRTWDLWARIMFPRRFVGNEYFVTMRVWDLLLVWCIWIWIWDWGCSLLPAVGAVSYTHLTLPTTPYV